MRKIRIVDIPPGFAPAWVREDWLELEIPLATEKELRDDPPTGTLGTPSNENGFIVLTSEAIKALEGARKYGAARFWRNLSFGKYLEFKKEVCQEVE